MISSSCFACSDASAFPMASRSSSSRSFTRRTIADSSHLVEKGFLDRDLLGDNGLNSNAQFEGLQEVGQRVTVNQINCWRTVTRRLSSGVRHRRPPNRPRSIAPNIDQAETVVRL